MFSILELFMIEYQITTFKQIYPAALLLMHILPHKKYNVNRR